MKAPFLAIALVLVVLLAGSSVFAQAPSTTTTPAAQPGGDPGITPNGVIGEVKVIDNAAKQLIVKTDAGSLVTVALADSTSYMRLPPGEKTLDKATKIVFADLGEGDRVFARGKVADDRQSFGCHEQGGYRQEAGSGTSRMEEARSARHHHRSQAGDERDHDLEPNDGWPAVVDYSGL